LGYWSKLDLVKDFDVRAVAKLDDIEGDEEQEEDIEDGWDVIPK
jgi:hypothetical protein